MKFLNDFSFSFNKFVKKPFLFSYRFCSKISYNFDDLHNFRTKMIKEEPLDEVGDGNEDEQRQTYLAMTLEETLQQYEKEQQRQAGIASTPLQFIKCPRCDTYKKSFKALENHLCEHLGEFPVLKATNGWSFSLNYWEGASMWFLTTIRGSGYRIFVNRITQWALKIPPA